MDKKEGMKSINSINSSYILEEVFSFLHERNKLDLIIYNKQLQEILHIDIGDFKKLSGKYKIGEKNGKGKEYLLDKDDLIFEGEFEWKKKRIL